MLFLNQSVSLSDCLIMHTLVITDNQLIYSFFFFSNLLTMVVKNEGKTGAFSSLGGDIPVS